MTPAMAYFTKRQKRYPLRGFDRAQYLYQVLKSQLPEELQELVSSGGVVIGELTRNQPEIQTVPIDGTSAVIEFNSGMMDFFYAVIRTLAGSMVRATESGPENKPAVPVTDVARDTAALFRQWKWPKSWCWTVRRIRYPLFQIPDKIRERILEFSKYTELFLLAHELGHVEMDCGIVVEDGRAVTTPMNHVKGGQSVVTGHDGVRVEPRPRSESPGVFEVHDAVAEHLGPHAESSQSEHWCQRGVGQLTDAHLQRAAFARARGDPFADQRR